MPERVPLQLTAKDFKSDQEVRWCPGCGDYAILAAMQAFMPELGIPRENVVFISGIGCSSRFPYYMNTYGIHSIHGRAPAIATGLAVSRPDLSVWVVTGDGDALSIGGNHLIHALRRNVNVKILLFNNRIYGLTKGQYSPTSEIGKVTKSTPMGSADAPFNPLSLALGAEASFVARSIDSDRKHLMSVLRAAAAHEGSAFVEIYQNCNIFNDDAFEVLKDPATRDDYLIRLEHGSPVTFGAARQPNQNDGGAARQPNQDDGGAARQPNQDDGGAARQPNQNGGAAEGEWCVTHPPGAFGLEVRRTSEVAANEILVHDETIPGPAYAFALSRLPQLDLRYTPIGVFRNADRPSYDSIVRDQVETAKATVDDPDAELASLLRSGDTWTIV